MGHKHNITDRQSVTDCLNKHNSDINKDVATCSVKCPPLCLDEIFSVSVRYEKPKAGENKTVRMLFYYPKMTEKTIRQTPAYHFSALVANFGGTLGLMAGMSAISVIEMC